MFTILHYHIDGPGCATIFKELQNAKETFLPLGLWKEV